MFPWNTSNSSYYEDSSHQWTDYHDAIVNHHLKLGEMPHADTHTKEQAMTWAYNIGDYFQELNVSCLVASIASLLVHHRVSHQEAKQIALELSHHCNNISNFSNLIGSFWDKYVTHKPRQVDPSVNTARIVANSFRPKLSK